MIHAADSTDTATPFDGTELDFWLGEWECTWEGGHGSNRIERAFDGKVTHERFPAEPDPDGSAHCTGKLSVLARVAPCGARPGSTTRART